MNDMPAVLREILHPTSLLWIAHILIAIALSVRVIMNRPATGVALAWLLVINSLPIAGSVIYLLIGERRIGRNRLLQFQRLREDFRKIVELAVDRGLTDVDWSRHSHAAHSMARLGWNLIGSPPVHGSCFHLYDKTPDMLGAITRDVDSAATSVLMEFYIWHEGGLADEVLESLIRAAKRGVTVCLLVDALGARPWWKGAQPKRLRDAGVELRPALPVGIFRSFVGRTDLRLHRKIIVIDGSVAWTGSMNLVDSRFFKQDAGVGEWVDAMVRLEGAVVSPLAATMLGDWTLEGNDSLPDLVDHHQLRLADAKGDSDIQVIPSGPGETSDGLLQMILTMINDAKDELILTTPYLVPDESLLRAIRGAAARGVDVRVIIPEKIDSFLTRYASRSYYDELLESGIKVFLYRDGLLHTKSIAVDGTVSMFGTVNLDMRSLWLNYEVALFFYDADFTSKLRQLQQSYLDESDRLDPEKWEARSFGNRLLENTMRLMSPLL